MLLVYIMPECMPSKPGALPDFPAIPSSLSGPEPVAHSDWPESCSLMAVQAMSVLIRQGA